MKTKIFHNSVIRRIVFSFSIQLFFLHLKKHPLIILFWLIFFGFVTQTLAPNYGAAYLFLDPEYLGKTSVLSYFMVGFACGGFIMAYNMASYTMNSFRFPFLATLYNPFLKFCVNNFIIPLVFILTYCISLFTFLRHEENFSIANAFLMIASFLIGNTLFITIALSYFFKTNKDIYKMFGVRHQNPLADFNRKKLLERKSEEWKNPRLIKESRDWYVETYLTGKLKTRLVRAVSHYKKEMIKSVFKQNHKNAALFEIITILSLIVLGLFKDNSYFEIPAGASLFLLFTMFLMLTSALHTLLRGWSGFAFIAILLIINSLYTLNFLNSQSKVAGLNYDNTPSEYSLKTIGERQNIKEDFNSTTQTLEKWKAKNNTNTKPKLVLINTSGGGLRSSLWTLYSLQYADSLLEGKLLNQTFLITGSSGGMIGAAYLRELMLQKQKREIKNLYAKKYRDNISKDILNPIGFNIATNDLLFRFQKYNDGKHSYIKDRGYAFEKKLNKNAEGLFNKRLRDYVELEKNATIPLMIFTPTIVNDSRKLVISSQPISYLTQNIKKDSIQINSLNEYVEYSSLFSKQDAMNTKFSSILRMNGTFPYVMPVMSLPSNPRIEIMDAGMRDNYGLETTMKFLYVFHKWIEENTSGVIIIQIRDRHKTQPIEENPNKSVMKVLTAPFASLYGNLFQVQDFRQNELVEYAGIGLKTKIDFIDFELQNDSKKNISLSWHLTRNEKFRVVNSINIPENQRSLIRLQELLK